MTEKASPSTAAVAIAVAIVAGTVGYFFGQGSSIGLFGSSGHPRNAKRSWPNSYNVNVHVDSSDEELQGVIKKGRTVDEESGRGDESATEELKGFEGYGGEVKLMLVVRTDLGMTKGESPN